MEGAIIKIENINKEIKRILLQLKTLRKEKLKAEEILVKAMKTYRVEEYKGYKLSKIDPSRKPKRKKENEKREAMFRILRDEGIEDPMTIIKRIKLATKSTIPEEIVVEDKM